MPHTLHELRAAACRAPDPAHPASLPSGPVGPGSLGLGSPFVGLPPGGPGGAGLGARGSGCGGRLGPADPDTHVHVVRVLVPMSPLLHTGAQGGDGRRALLEGWKAGQDRPCEQQGGGGTTRYSRPAPTAPREPARGLAVPMLRGVRPGGLSVLDPGWRGAPSCRVAGMDPPGRPPPRPRSHRACWGSRSWPRSRSGPAARGSGPRRPCGLGQDRHRCGPRRTGGPAPARCSGAQLEP